MQHIKSQQGYTLVLVLGIFVIFTILGFGMMTMTMQGAQKSENRESMTQAQDLAVKGIDHIVAEINNRMKNETKSYSYGGRTVIVGPISNGVSALDFDTKLKAILSEYSCNEGRVINAQTGNYDYCVVDFDKSANFPHIQVVNFKTVGISKDSTTKNLYSTVEIGSSEIGTPTGYALYAYKTDDNTKGDLEIHGAVKVNGDLYAGNNFFTSNMAKYKYNHKIESLYPIITNTNRKAKIEVVNGAKTKNWMDIEKPPANKTISTPLPTPSTILNDQTALLNQNPNQKSEAIFSKPIEKSHHQDIDGKIKTVKKTFLTADQKKFNDDVKTITTSAFNSLNNNYSLLTIDRYHNTTTYLARGLHSTESFVELAANISSSTNHNWTLTANNTLNNVYFPNNLLLQYGVNVTDAMNKKNRIDRDLLESLNTNPVLTVQNAYIEKDMTVGLGLKSEANFDLFDNVLKLDIFGLLSLLEALSNIETTVELHGNYYVNGNLTIAGAKLKGNATLYVNGNATIIFSEIGRQSSINELDANINIIANGEVKIAYISDNHNIYHKNQYVQLDSASTSKWNGHIHSNKKISIEGASSNLEINGSISAPEIILSSIIGRAEASCEALIDANNLSGVGLTRARSHLSSNCFEQAATQNLSNVDVYLNLIDVLRIVNIPIAKINHTLKPRLTINYKEIPGFTPMSTGRITSVIEPQITERK